MPSDPVEGVNQTCCLRVNEDSTITSGLIIESLNTDVGGLHDAFNAITPKIAEESLLVEGDVLEFDNSLPKLDSGENFIVKMSCKKGQCSLTDSNFHRVSNYTERDSLIRKRIDCLGIDMKVVTFKLSCLTSANCSYEETSKYLLNDFNWFENRIKDLKHELRELAATKDRVKLIDVLKEQETYLLSLVSSSKDCLTIREIVIELD